MKERKTTWILRSLDLFLPPRLGRSYATPARFPSLHVTSQDLPALVRLVCVILVQESSSGCWTWCCRRDRSSTTRRRDRDAILCCHDSRYLAAAARGSAVTWCETNVQVLRLLISLVLSGGLFFAAGRLWGDKNSSSALIWHFSLVWLFYIMVQKKEEKIFCELTARVLRSVFFERHNAGRNETSDLNCWCHSVRVFSASWLMSLSFFFFFDFHISDLSGDPTAHARKSDVTWHDMTKAASAAQTRSRACTALMQILAESVVRHFYSPADWTTVLSCRWVNTFVGKTCEAFPTHTHAALKRTRTCRSSNFRRVNGELRKSQKLVCAQTLWAAFCRRLLARHSMEWHVGEMDSFRSTRLSLRTISLVWKYCWETRLWTKKNAMDTPSLLSCLLSGLDVQSVWTCFCRMELIPMRSRLAAGM